MDNKILLNMKVWLEKHIDTMFLCFGIVVSVSVLLIQFLSLKNNLIFSDEGWYLVLLRDIPHFGSSRFHLLFNNVFQNNIYLIRVFCWCLLFLGSVVLSLGLTSYIKKSSHDKSWYIFLWAFISVMLGQMYIHDCPSLNYITLNIIVAELSIGCLLLGLSRGNFVYYLLSGFIISALVPIMITNTVIIPLMCIVILLLSNTRWRYCGIFVVGIGLFLVFYFTVIERPSSFFEFVQEETGNVISRGGAHYGIVFFVKWLINAGLFIFKQLIVALAIYATYQFMKQHTFTYNRFNKCKIWIAVILIVGVFFFFHSFLHISPLGDATYEGFYRKLLGFKYIYWVLLFILLLDAIVQQRLLDSNKMILGLFLFIVPICLAFGTNVTFYVRGVVYMMFLTPIIVYLSSYKSIYIKGIVFGVFLFFYCSMINNVFNGTNWHGETLFGNKICVEQIGINQHINIDEYYINKINSCKKHIPQSETIILSSENWGIVSLLDYKPITYEFDVMRLDSIEFSEMIYNKINIDGRLWAISECYSKSFNYRIEQMECAEIAIDSIVAGDNRYFLLKKNEYEHSIQ